MTMRRALLTLVAFSGLSACDSQRAEAPGSMQPARDTVATTAAPAGVQSSPRELVWDDLIPKAWDPAEALAEHDLGTLEDSDPRATEVMTRLRREWDRAPVEASLSGQRVRIPGFVVPLETKHRNITEFLLVPYFGACIHMPPPPANQIIHVLRDEHSPTIETMEPVWVTGIIETVQNQSWMGNSGYRIASARVARYEGAQR